MKQKILHNMDAINILQNVADTNDGDIYLFSAEVNDNTADVLIQLIRSHEDRRKNCILILTTNGGDPDAGYRIVRLIKRYYERLILYVYGSCKSTGTLIALGADEIVMGDFGEFGPLDIQLTRDDEMSNTSGLSYLQSLTQLNEQIFRSFEVNFLNLKQKSSNTITTRTAAEIGTKLAVGLISQISAQLDPVKLGEVHRAIKIADAYGKRLCTNNEKNLSKLIVGYPSHSFVIDIDEAQTLFANVKYVNDRNDDFLLENMLFEFVRREGKTSIIKDLTFEFLQQESELETPESDDLHNNDESVTTENTAEYATNISTPPLGNGQIRDN
jgi:hypothetical protein